MKHIGWSGRVVTVAIGMSLSALAPLAASAEELPVRYRDEIFTEILVTSDVEYGRATNSRGELEVLKLDVLEPAGDTEERRGALVWVHGGYFRQGDKASTYEAPHIRKYVLAGWVTLSINYRLRPELPHGAGPIVLAGRIDEAVEAIRDAQHDAQAAIRWVRANASSLRVDPEQVAIAGHSAGGITATSVAFNSDDVGNSGNPGYDSRPAAAVSNAGGGLPGRTVHISTGEPPILFVHGLVDDVVPYPSAVMPCVATLAMANACEQVLDPDQGHGIFAVDRAREFLHRWLFAHPGTREPARVTLVGLPVE